MKLAGTIAIVGAGLAGLALARTLLRMGVAGDRLHIFEAQAPGAGASGLPAALMHLTPGRSLFPKPGYARCFEFSQTWLQDLQASSDLHLAHPLPLLRPALEPASALRFERSFARLEPDLPAHISRLSPAQLREQATIFVLPETTYLVQPAWRVAMPVLIQVLSQELQRAGVLIQPESVLSLLPPTLPGKGWAVQTSSGSHAFDSVVLAVAASLPEWFPALPLQRIRGEVAVLRHPSFEGLASALSTGGYLLPLGQDCALAGPTFYPFEQPIQAPAFSEAQIRQGLQAVIPIITEAKLERLWSGVRTLVQHQREPLVGEVPGHEGLFVFSAFATKGLLQIPWLAQLLAEHLLTGRDFIPEIFHAARFSRDDWHLACP